MPAPTYAEFVVTFPEFDTITPTAYVTERITQAEALLDEEAFGEADNVMYNHAVGYMAAHLLALSPYGLQLSLVNEDGDSVYHQAYKTIYLPRVTRRGMLL